MEEIRVIFIYIIDITVIPVYIIGITGGILAADMVKLIRIYDNIAEAAVEAEARGTV